MKYLSKFAVVSFLFVLLLISSLPAQTNGSIEGYVLDSQTAEALPGANVQLQGTSIGAAADIKGKYVIHQVPPGEYKLVITYIGYHEVILDISVGEGEDVRRRGGDGGAALDVQGVGLRGHGHQETDQDHHQGREYADHCLSHGTSLRAGRAPLFGRA